MKKRFTLLSVLTIASSLSFAQNFPTLNTMKMNPSKIALNTATETNGTITPKAGGDLIWENNFATTDPAWTMGNVAPGVQGAWQTGAYPTDMTDYMGAFPNGIAPMGTFNGVQYLLTASAANPVGLQNAYLESATIDLSAAAMVTVSWDQIYRRFNHDVTYVDVSTNNGTTWTSYQVNGSVTPNASAVKNTVNLNIPTASSTTCKIRFRWESLTADNDYGSGYGWAIDNVKITEGYLNNVGLLNLYSVVGSQELTYTRMPVAQAAVAGNISFGARVKNTGINAQDIVLKMTSGAYDQSSAAVNVTSLMVDTLEVVPANGFPVPSTIGTSTITGTLITGNTLAFTSDDAASLKLDVTNNIYAADSYDGTPASLSGSFTGWQNGVGDAEIGTYFEMFADASIGAIQIGIANVSTANQGQYIGKTVRGKIYEVEGGVATLLDASYEATVSASSFGNIVNAYMINQLPLEAGKLYLVTAAFSEGAEVPIAMAGTTIGGSVAGFNGGTITGLRASDEAANLVRCPVVRLDFTNYTGVEAIAAQYDLNVYPNPFSANTEVAFELKNDANVSINVTDITGRTVATVDSQMYTSGAHKVSVNGTNLTAGVYNCTITIGNNVITKRIVKK
ncbi:MAG: T9SS type A sorting domain-containing protein [Crocinitomicaceae bacterium]|nr:T9SS type A sorting domain-containing protein [Crocinitomicaceae bacterium]